MRRFGTGMAAMTCFALLATACSSGSSDADPSTTQASASPTVPIPSTEQTVVPVSNVVQLGNGATVTFLEPLAAGSNVLVRTTAERKLAPGQVATVDPVQLTVKNGSLGPSGAVLTFPVPDAAWADGDPSDAAGISTLDETTGEWMPVPVQFDAATKTMRTTAPHFSWWAPWTWDWVSIGARINQNVGEVVNKRQSAPECKRGQQQPDWVSSTAGINIDSGLVVRACAEGEGDVLAIELVNNRPYGLVLTYGGPVKWGWHDGGSALDMARNGFVDALMRPDQLYLPPLSKASVGILRSPAGSNATWRISVASGAVAGDVLRIFADELLSHLPIKDFTSLKVLGECAAFLAGAEPEFSKASILQKMKDSTNCILAAYSKAANGKTIAELEKARATFSALKQASLVGRLIKFYDYEWTFLDLIVDNGYALGPELGFGFSVYSKAVIPEPTAPPVTQPPATEPPATQPAVTQPPVTQPPVTQPPVTQPPATQPPVTQPPAQTWEEIVWGPPGSTVPLFSGGPGVNSNGAAGPAARIPVGTHTTVDCRAYNQAIAPGNNGGWWYHISAGQYAGYWTGASVYENGDGPWPASGHSVDAAVRVC